MTDDACHQNSAGKNERIVSLASSWNQRNESNESGRLLWIYPEAVLGSMGFHYERRRIAGACIGKR